MKKITVIFVFVILNLNIYADFLPGEKPVWAINSDTAYTLNKGYWVIDVSGPVTYGLTDRIHLGTIFWFWYEKMSNFYCKFNLFQENEKIPAISLLYKLLITSYYNNIFYSSTSLIFSKQMGENTFFTCDLTIHTLDLIKIDENKSNFIIDIMKQLPRDGMSTIVSTINVSAIYFFSKSTRFIIELSSSLFDNKISYNATENTIYFPPMFIYSGIGFEWALGENLRLKLSILSSFFISYFPYVNVTYKFD